MGRKKLEIERKLRFKSIMVKVGLRDELIDEMNRLGFKTLTELFKFWLQKKVNR